VNAEADNSRPSWWVEAWPDALAFALGLGLAWWEGWHTTDSGLMAPYKNVMRMHFLIFFFAFTHFVHLENFAVYAVVYFVYFFPWRLLRQEKASAARAA